MATVCPRCGQPIKGPTAWHEQQIYHQACYNQLHQELMTDAFKKRFPDNDSRLIGILQFQQESYLLLLKQEKHLATIETLLIIFACLVGLSVLITSCSALGLV